MQPSTNSRATLYISNTKDENNALKIISQIKDMQTPTLHYVLCKFMECNLIREEPEFLQILFKNHTYLILQMVQWMLVPKHIAKRKKIKSNIDFFPYRCKQFMRDNISFYEKLYLYARTNQNLITIWFNFLKKQYYDKDTIMTALGYFAEVMVPFAKYQFSVTHFMQNQMSMDSISIVNKGGTQQVRSSDKQRSQTINIMKILPKSSLAQLIQNSHYQPIFQFLKTSILVSLQNPTDHQISKSTLLKILLKCQMPNLFLHAAALFHDQDTVRGSNISTGMGMGVGVGVGVGGSGSGSGSGSGDSDVLAQIDLLENVAYCLKELVGNIEGGGDMQVRVQLFIGVIVEAKIINYVVDQILMSRYCANTLTQSQSCQYTPTTPKQQLTSPKTKPSLSYSQQLPKPPTTLSHTNSTILKSQRMPSTTSNLYTPSPIHDHEQQDLMEILLMILNYATEIFTRVPKMVPCEGSRKELLEDQIEGNGVSVGDTRGERYRKFVCLFREQLQYMMNNLYTAVRIVYNKDDQSSNTKTIPFSSGQKIKPVSLMKLQFLKLINSCLLAIRTNTTTFLSENNNNTNLLAPEKDRQKEKQKQKQKQKDAVYINLPLKKINSVNFAPFELNFQRLCLIQIIERYLSQNRWNNIVQRVIEKICHSLIICGYDYIKKNVQKDKNKKLTQSFLAFLVQNFTQRDYIFLNTLKFTTQGNLHSIYTISKDLAYTLNSTNKLIVLLNQFEPWKKFIMNDLKIYEEKTFPGGIKPSDDGDYQQETYIKVDQADTIKRLIQNISDVKKWPSKITRVKGASKSGIIGYSNKQFNTDDLDPKLPTIMSKSHNFYFPNKKKQSTKRPIKIGLQDMCKKKVDQSIQCVTQHQFQDIINVSDISIGEKEKDQLSRSEVKLANEELDKQIQNQIRNVFSSYAVKSTSFTQKLDLQENKQEDKGKG